MIHQSVWLTGCDRAEGRKWTEQRVFCCLSLLSARGDRKRRTSALVRLSRQHSWQLHTPPGMPWWSSAKGEAEERSRRPAALIESVCLRESLFTEYSPSRSIWHLTYFAEWTQACSDTSLPQFSQRTQTLGSVALSNGRSKGLPGVAAKKRDSHLSFPSDTFKFWF